MRPMLEDDQAVKKFNSLARNQKAPSGLVPNIWHFDLRFIPLNPPSHILFFLQPESHYIHHETIQEDITTGVTFFPETDKEAAPQIARSIIKAFNNNMASASSPISMPPFGAPWALTTEDPLLAHEVEQEFKRIGVKEDRCNIFSVSSPEVCEQAHDAFDRFYSKLKESCGFEPIIQKALETPTSITFPSESPAETSALWKTNPNKGLSTKALHYAEAFVNARPPGPANADFDSLKLLSDVEKDKTLFSTTPKEVAKRAADSGSGFPCLDYAMRLKFGIGCQSDRLLCRVYLTKALACERAINDGMKATAHALLTDWFVSGCTGSMPLRYVYSASHHAQEGIRLSRKYAKKGDLPAAPLILRFALHIFEGFTEDVPVLGYLYKDVWEAIEQRKKQVADERERMTKKRLKEPNRYRCAAVGCVIQADAGRMLQKCSGKCDFDKKPHYCSRECQVADWPNHKPYCKPGAECSVIDDGTYDTGVGASKKGALNVPVTHGDGSVTYISSSSMSPSYMKDLKANIEALSSGGFDMSSIRTEMGRIPGTESDQGRGGDT